MVEAQNLTAFMQKGTRRMIFRSDILSAWAGRMILGSIGLKKSLLKVGIKNRGLFEKGIKYLGIKIDENVNWKQHIHDITIKLNSFIFLQSFLYNFLFFTIKNYVNRHTLRTNYFTQVPYSNSMIF